MAQVSKGLKQSYDAQDLAFAALEAFKASHTSESTGKLCLVPGDESRLLSLMNAWQIAQNRVAFHRRVPSPGSLTHKAPAIRKAGRNHATSGPVSLPTDIVDVSAEVAPDTTPEPGSVQSA